MTNEQLFSQKRAADNDARRSYGFTRVRARSNGVCGSPRLAATGKFAVVKFAAVKAPGAMTSREPTVSLVEPRSSILEDSSPCSTSPTLLIGLPRSFHKRMPQPYRRNWLAAWSTSREDRCMVFVSRGPEAGEPADPPGNFVLAANSTLLNVVRAADSRRASRYSDGLSCPSPAFEQFADYGTAATPRDATSSRTRRPPRVLHEERNARQCDAAGRKPHRHY